LLPSAGIRLCPRKTLTVLPRIGGEILTLPPLAPNRIRQDFRCKVAKLNAGKPKTQSLQSDWE